VGLKWRHGSVEDVRERGHQVVAWRREITVSKWKTKLAMVAVLAVTASTFVSASPTLAQEGRSLPPAPIPRGAPALPASETFVPAPPTLTADDAALLTEPPTPGTSTSLRRPGAGDIAPTERTTAMARHSVDANGKGTADLYAEPAFRRQGDRWVDVDSTLRRSTRPGQPVAAEGALRPVRFGSSAQRILELGLDQGPVTLSSPSLKLAGPALEGDTVVYHDVATDTDMRYIVSDDGVKEELVLRSASAPRSFSFHLADPSGQLGTPNRDDAGAWTFPNPVEEGIFLTLPPALAFEQGPEGEPVASDPTSAQLELVPAGDGWDLTVSVDPAWLEGKSFPVVLDPTLSYSANTGDGPTLEGYAIRQDGGCGGSCFLTRDSYLYAGSWAPYNPVRSYARYDLSDIPEDARIDSTSLRIYNSGCMVVRSPDPCASKNHYIALHRMLDNWYSSSRYDELAAGTASSPFTPWIQRSAGASPSFHFWTDGLTSQVQRWVNRADPNHGFAIRSLYESPDQAGPAYLSSRTSTTSRRPSLSVSYTVVAPNTPEVAAFAGNGAARVHWGIPNSGGAPITSYLIKTYRSGTHVATKTVTCPCPTVAAVEGLTNGSSYSFSVQAVNSVGSSTAATSASVTPSSAFPTAPSPGSAGPGNASAAASWRHPSTGAADVDAYVVQVYDPETGYVGEVVRMCPCATTLGIGGLVNGKTYILGVYAYNDAGYSVPALTTIVTPSSTRPGTPREATAQGSPGAIQVSWLAPSSGPAPTAYTLVPYDSLTGEVAGKSNSITCPCSSLSATLDGLAPGRTYLVAVKASTSAGTGSPTIAPAVTLPGVPGAPSGLQSMPGDGAAVVAWESSSPNGSPVSGYTLTASPGEATTTVAGDVTAAVFEGLANDTAYSFTAVATNAVGDSIPSAPSGTVTPSADPLGRAPSNVVATRGDTEVHVSWDKPLVNLDLIGLTNYTVTTHDAATGARLKDTPADGSSSVTVTDLKNGTPVYFTVTADTLGLGLFSGTSGQSNTVTPAGPPFAPRDITAARGDERLELSWLPPAARSDGTPGDNGDPITSYTVTVFEAEGNTVVRTIENAVSPLPVENLSNGTTYYFTVRATNSVGTGPDSNTSNFIAPAGRPEPPSDVVAMVRNNDARVVWTAPVDNGSPITGYTIFGSNGIEQAVFADATSTTIFGLQEGLSYTFTVVAVNDVGASDPSAPSNVVSVTRVPSAPGNATATAGVGEATVAWTPAAPNGAEILYYTIRSVDGPTVMVPGNATSATVRGLSPGSFHAFSIFATNIVGDGPPIVSNSAQIPANPDSPFNVSAAGVQQGAELRWIAPPTGGSPITSYTVTASPGGVQVVVNNNFGPGEYPFTTVPGLDPATTYTFTVVATNTAGDSTTSEPSNSVRPLTEREALRQQADRYMMVPLDEFLVAKGQAPEPFEWSDNGCSFPGPYPIQPEFLEPCQRHDFAYRNYGSGLSLAPDEETRHWIDDILLVDMFEACNGNSFCEGAASDTYLGVRGFSGFFYG
jgi:titin